MTVIASGEIDLKLSAQSVARLENDLSKLSNKAGGAKGALSGLMSSITPQALIGGVAAAGTAIAAFAASSVSHFTKTAQSVRALQRVTGQSAEDASHLVAAFDDMGISADVAASAMFKLAKNSGDGGQKLGALGIEVAKAKDGTTDLQGTFLNVADAVAATKDPAEKAAIAFGAFGKQGAALLPILEKGRAGIEKLFASSDLNFSQKQLDSAEDYRLAMDALGDSVGKVQNRLGAALVPALADTARGTALVIDKTLAATESGGALSGALGFLGNVAGTVVPAIGGAAGVAGALGELGKKGEDAVLTTEELTAVGDALGISTGNLTGKTKDQVQALLDEKEAMQGVIDTQLAAFDANFAYQDSLNNTEDAAAAVTAKQVALNEAVAKYGAGTPQVIAATEDLSRAQLAQQEQALRSAAAAGTLAFKQEELATGTGTASTKLNAQLAELRRQRDQIAGAGGNTSVIDGMIASLEKIQNEYKAVVSVEGVDFALIRIQNLQLALDRAADRAGTGPHVQSTRPAHVRAHGGPVGAGDYFVGERDNGGEFLHLEPGSRGYVTSQQRSQQILNNNDNRNVTFNVIDNTGNPRVMAEVIARRLGERSQR